MPDDDLIPPEPARDTQRADRLRLVAVAVVLLAATAIATLVAHASDRDRRDERHQTAAAQARSSAQLVAARLVDTVRDVEGLYAASQDVTSKEFFRFAQPAIESGAASVISRVDDVPNDKRAAYERELGREIWVLRDGNVVPAPTRPRYAVVARISSRGLARPVIGYDAFDDPRRAPALHESARTGEPVATGVIRLADNQRPGVLVFAPRYRAGAPVETEADRRRALVGWVAGALDARQLGLAVKAAAGDGLRIERDGRILVALGSLQGAPETRTFDIAGSRWTVEVGEPSGPVIPAAAWIALLGLIGTFFVTLLLRQTSISELRARQLASLRAAERDRAVRTSAADRAATKVLLDQLPDIAMLRYDKDLRITVAAGGLVAGTGRTTAQLVGRTPDEVLVADQASALIPAMRAALDGADQSFPARTGGRRMWIRTVCLVPDEEALLVFTDVTGLEEAEAGRAEAEARFQQAFDDAPVGMTLMDLQGRFLEVNRALCEMTGFTSEQLKGRTFSVLSRSEDIPALADALRSQATGEAHRVTTETRAVHSAGQTLWLEIHSTTLAGPDGRPAMVLSQVLDVSDRRRFEARLQYMADHDPLTGLANRRSFERSLDNQLANVRRYGAQGALLVFDLDHFKAINDTLGHTAGDAIIVNTARILRDLLRESDVVARLGGDEFAILLPRADEEEALDVASRLVAAIRERGSVLEGQRPGSVTASVGVTLLAPEQETGEQALVDADLAMYDAKEAGRDRFAAFHRGAESVPSRMKARLTWLERIRSALEQERLTLVAQPIQSLADNRVTHYELLLRMIDDHGDLIPPGAFLHIAERFGLISEIDAWVSRRAIQALRDCPNEEAVFEVNLSGASIGSTEILQVIEDELRRTQVDPQRLIFEITETAAVANVPDAREFAERLGELGCRFALDDFGAGFGSFYYLKHLPCDFLKIDGEFIRNFASTPTDQVIVAGLVRIARGLGKQTIAEFVGDEETVDLLRKEGVDMAQGYHVGRPAPLEQLLGSRDDSRLRRG